MCVLRLWASNIYLDCVQLYITPSEDETYNYRNNYKT